MKLLFKLITFCFLFFFSIQNVFGYKIYKYKNSTQLAIEYLETGWNAATSPMVAHGVIGLGTTTGIDAIKYYFASANFGAGNAVLYGVTK